METKNRLLNSCRSDIYLIVHLNLQNSIGFKQLKGRFRKSHVRQITLKINLILRHFAVAARTYMATVFAKLWPPHIIYLFKNLLLLLLKFSFNTEEQTHLEPCKQTSSFERRAV